MPAVTLKSFARVSRRPPPYHMFETLGERFVYDTSTCRFYRVDEATHAFLNACRAAPADEVARTLVDQGRFPRDTVSSVAHEVDLLAQNGLFDAPDYSISPERFERELEQRYTKPWNKLELALAETCNLPVRTATAGPVGKSFPTRG